MVYTYGSPISHEYDRVRFVRKIAPLLPEDDEVFLHNGSTNWRENCNEIPQSLFFNVCHWKSTMGWHYLCGIESYDQVNGRWANAIRPLMNQGVADDSVENALTQLTQLAGIAVARASALLTAWNPREFGIIDRKVVHVLDMRRSLSIARYLEFLRKLREMRDSYPELHSCALRQIELALWHYFPLQEAGTRGRADDQAICPDEPNRQLVCGLL